LLSSQVLFISTSTGVVVDFDVDVDVDVDAIAALARSLMLLVLMPDPWEVVAMCCFFTNHTILLQRYLSLASAILIFSALS
jgi:hypothetical protein